MGKITTIKIVWQEEDQEGDGWFHADINPTEDLYTALERAIEKVKASNKE